MLRKLPFYLKTTIILLGLTLSAYILYALHGILIPLCFALFLAMLLNPLYCRLMRWKIPKVPAIALTLLIAVLLLSGISYFLFTQFMHLTDQLPLLQKKSAALLDKGQNELAQHYGIPLDKQNRWLEEARKGIKSLAGPFLGTMIGTLSTLLLLPVYTFLFLYYKVLILDFLYEIFAEKNIAEVSTVLRHVKSAIQNYMFGLLVEGLIVASLNALALLALGVPYAILLGILGALLNVLPFVGGILAAFLPILMATITKDGIHTQIGIAISYIVIQFIDNHFLIPYIVSAKVRINALISIVVVLLGGALWGISGMFLSIPFIGVLKIIFDRVPELRPWGKLLGDEVPLRHRGQIRIVHKTKSAVQKHTV